MSQPSHPVPPNASQTPAATGGGPAEEDAEVTRVMVPAASPLLPLPPSTTSSTTEDAEVTRVMMPPTAPQPTRAVLGEAEAEATRAAPMPHSPPTLRSSGYEQTMIIRGAQAAPPPRTVASPRPDDDAFAPTQQPTPPPGLLNSGLLGDVFGRPTTELPVSPQRTRAATLPGGPEQPGDSTVQQVGRYLIRERLGRGGMATVFRAHDPTLNRDVAIKFLHASLCADDEYRARFLREARAAGGLSHPNIVIVHDVGEIDGRPYMAMELIDGVSVADELEKHRTMSVRDVVVMGMQLARALDYSHGKGIVHRDIKPGNIMRLSGTQTVKVTDFGIAHIEDTSEGEHTRVGDVLGTPQYMSPEQANGDKLDGRSDLFSTGIVLYQMLTGRRPFRGDTLVAVATRIAKDDPTPISKYRQDVPASLRRVIDRCLAKQPGNRFQTGKELADALAKVLGELDEVARDKGRARIVPLRVKWAATMALIVAVVMGLTTAVVTQRQYGAMMAQVSDYGASLARFIAAQNAASVLGDDWDAVEVAVQEIMKTRNFERVTVIDLSGVVRVSSQANLVGQVYRPEGAESLGRLSGIAATRYVVNGSPVLGFEAPVTFQDKQVGRVALGIPEEPLTQVARLSITLMIALAVVTVLAVAVAMYFVANWFAKPIRLVADSMTEIGKGRFDHRINEQRRDEFGELYQAFDAMAQALQDREAGAVGSPPTMVPTGRHTGIYTQASRRAAADSLPVPLDGRSVPADSRPIGLDSPGNGAPPSQPGSGR
ncbi:MAG: protein kinase [Aquabacterium sp.]|nr:protein kinase [Aquabacterium sp.]